MFGEFSVEENLRVGAHTRPKDRAANLERVYDLFPRLLERRTQARATCPAASSRCSPWAGR